MATEMEATPAKVKDLARRDEALILLSLLHPTLRRRQRSLNEGSVEGCEEQATGFEEGSTAQRRDLRISTVTTKANPEGIRHVLLSSKERYLIDEEACCKSL